MNQKKWEILLGVLIAIALLVGYYSSATIHRDREKAPPIPSTSAGVLL